MISWIAEIEIPLAMRVIASKNDFSDNATSNAM
jgi:hypothetical protein